MRLVSIEPKATELKQKNCNVKKHTEFPSNNRYRNNILHSKGSADKNKLCIYYSVGQK